MAAKVFKQNYSALVKILPMNNAEFRAELFSHDLLHGDCNAKIQSSSMTQAEKAEYFLTNEIQPELSAGVSTKKFEDLLEIMSMSGLDALANIIKGMLQCTCVHAQSNLRNCTVVLCIYYTYMCH